MATTADWLAVWRHRRQSALHLSDALELCAKHGLNFEMEKTTFFLGQETLIPHPRPKLPPWRELLFTNGFRNPAWAMDFFRIPYNRVVELRMQVAL